jgi:hypothetical protein
MRVLWAAMVAAMLAATGAQARDIKDCTDAGSDAAKVISFANADANTLAALRIVINVDLTANDQNGYGKMCARGAVGASDGNYFYIGSNQNVPPRVFLSPDNHQHVFYLSIVPTPKAAAEWERKTHEAKWPVFTLAQSMYMFAEWGAKRRVYRFFDRIPDDATLMQLMCDADAGLLSPLTVTARYAEPGKPLHLDPSPDPVTHAQCRTVLAMDAPPVTPSSMPGAAAPDAVPAGWLRSDGGTLLHTESNVKCTPTIGEFRFVRLEGASGTNTLGTCLYADGDARQAFVRVRRFVDGVGETQAAIDGDRVLMGTAPPPPSSDGKKPAYLARKQTTPDGKVQQTVTFVLRGLLVDCAVVTADTADEIQFGAKNFLSPGLAVGD